MNDTKKTLDITYGGFACHLEGFDHPIDTMKDIVTYFHDWSLHNRLTDSDPTTPDLGTLARMLRLKSGQNVEINGDAHQVTARVVPAHLQPGSKNKDPMEGISELYEANRTNSRRGLADKLRRLRAVVEGNAEEDSDDLASRGIFQKMDISVPKNPMAHRFSEYTHSISEARGMKEKIPFETHAPSPLQSKQLAPTSGEPSAEPSSEPVLIADDATARLRQIMFQKKAVAPQPSFNFVDYATVHGVTDLLDVLEAAAAHTLFVDKEPDFTRPQIMNKLLSASQVEITHEAGLRAFGNLLRTNRILKLANGRFILPPTSRFQPE